MGFEVISWSREWRRNQRCAIVGADGLMGCCRVAKRRVQVKILVAEVEVRAHIMVRSHSPGLSERASEQRDPVAGTEGLNGGRRHACAAGSGKQASTSTHTSQL